MAKVFLSHCSYDKEWYVEPVYSRLVKEIGKDSVVIDNVTFQEGRKTIEEIHQNLEASDLFVIFISDKALGSTWVQKELLKVEELFKEDKIQQICPIIIDKNIKHDDIRIPGWMRDEYNIQFINRQTKATSIIRQRMIEISFLKHPKLKQRNDLFVGRNEYLQCFEERIDDFFKAKPIVILVSGMEGLGRKTLIYRGLQKCSIVKESYQFPIISLQSDESIEDVILKVYDLGFSDIEVSGKLGKITIEEKEKMLLNMIKDLQISGEKILIEDNGCLVNHKGELCSWLSNILSDKKLSSEITLLIISRFRYYNKFYGLENEVIFSMAISELDQNERNGLLKRYSNFEDLDLEADYLKYISNLLSGYPEQVFFAVSMIKDRGWEYLKKHTDDIIDFNRKKSGIIIAKIQHNKEKMEILALLSSFDYIGIGYIEKIVGSDEKYSSYINEFYSSGICEYVGVMKEYLRVNGTIKDYITRSEYKVSDKHLKKIQEDVDGFLKNIESNDYDVPEFLFSLKSLLLKGEKLPEGYLIPSVYLKTMNELYYVGKNKEVVAFAGKALENEVFMDTRIVFEIRYLLCSALAKLRSERFKDEVMKISGPDHEFLFGFYYRQIGKFDKALEKINKSMDMRPNFSKAKREKVQAYIGMQDYESALEQSRINYENYRDNPYHIQAYFTCLIKSDGIEGKREILKALISNLELIGSEISAEMTLRCKAQYEAICNSNYDESMRLINKAIEINKNVNYARLAKFDIAERFSRLEEMEEIVNFFKHPDNKTRYSENIICMESIIKAKTDDTSVATEYFLKNIRNYTQEAKERFTLRLKKCGQIKEL